MLCSPDGCLALKTSALACVGNHGYVTTPSWRACCQSRVTRQFLHECVSVCVCVLCVRVSVCVCVPAIEHDKVHYHALFASK